MMSRYRHRDDAWRRIDTDWLNQAGTLALYLDSLTNNSSLALAIELVDSGKVLLFAADAQTGNWLSWQEITWRDPTVSTDDLAGAHRASTRSVTTPATTRRSWRPSRR